MTAALEKRRRSALHESGHAVIGRAAGFDVRKVEVYEDGGGKCWTTPIARSSLEDVQRELSYNLAGRLAVALEAGDPLWRLTLPLSLRDIVDKERPRDWPGTSHMGYAGYRRSVAELLYGREPEAERWLDKELPRIANETARVLTVRWDQVTDLATRLLKHGTVDLAKDARGTSSRGTSGAHREFALARTNPLRRTPTIRLLPVEIAASLRLLSNDNSTASSKAKVRSVLAEAGYELVTA